MKKSFYLILISISLSSLIYAQQENPPVQSADIIPPVKNDGHNTKRIAIGAGYTHRLGKINKNGVYGGFHIDLDAQNYFTKNVGVGINMFYILQDKTTTGESIIRKQSHRFFYLGPQLLLRTESNRLGFYAGGGAGAIYYIAKATLSNNEVAVNNTYLVLGGYLSAGGEYKLNRKTGIGLKVSGLAGKVKAPEFGVTPENSACPILC